MLYILCNMLVVYFFNRIILEFIFIYLFFNKYLLKIVLVSCWMEIIYGSYNNFDIILEL